MFCQNCGEQTQESAKFCSKCGARISTPNTVAEPFVRVAEPFVRKDIIKKKKAAIWNPNAASSWSLAFTPAFGSYLHALNWRALGEEQRANAAMRWFYFSLFMVVISTLIAIGTDDAERAQSTSRILALLYVFIWYFSAGKSQARYVKEKFDDRYQRRSWGKPLLVGLLSYLGYVFLLVTIRLAFD